VDVFRREGRNVKALGSDLEALEAEVERSAILR